MTARAAVVETELQVPARLVKETMVVTQPITVMAPVAVAVAPEVPGSIQHETTSAVTVESELLLTSLELALTTVAVAVAVSIAMTTST